MDQRSVVFGKICYRSGSRLFVLSSHHINIMRHIYRTCLITLERYTYLSYEIIVALINFLKTIVQEISLHVLYIMLLVKVIGLGLKERNKTIG